MLYANTDRLANNVPHPDKGVGTPGPAPNTLPGALLGLDHLTKRLSELVLVGERSLDILVGPRPSNAETGQPQPNSVLETLTYQIAVAHELVSTLADQAEHMRRLITHE